MSGIFYRGPSLATLHTDYARQDRIDPDAPVTTSRRVRIDAPADRVWAVLSDAARWPEVDPAIRKVRLDGPVAVDTAFSWRSGGARISSRFAVVDPGRELSWTGLAMGMKVVHRHLLSPEPDGSTLLVSEESMTWPVLVLLFGRRRLDAQLDRWLAALKAAAERDDD